MASDWIICELIRVFHNLSLEDAQDLVDSVSSRRIPDVWEVAGRKRVLRTDLSFSEQTLLLLYACETNGALIEDLFTWTRHSNKSVFQRDVIKPLDRRCLVDFDPDTEFVTVSPLGLKMVEEKILNSGN
jgi:hypothetical protein